MADESQARPSIQLQVQPAPSWHVSADGTALVAEPHHLILPQADLRLTDCSCPDCLQHGPGILGLEYVTPPQLVALLVGEGFGRVDLLLHRDLCLPDPDGDPTMVQSYLQYVSQVLAEAGLGGDWFVAAPPRVGGWVRTTAPYWVSPEHIVVPDQVGTIQPDPHGICTPGVSTMVLLEGRREAYGYPDGLLEALPGPPDESAIAEARERTRASLSLYEEIRGFSGYLKLGKGKPLTVEQARHQVGVAAEHFGRASEPERKGQLKRLKRVLKALAERAGCDTAAGLLARVTAGIDEQLAAELLEYSRRDAPS